MRLYNIWNNKDARISPFILKSMIYCMVLIFIGGPFLTFFRSGLLMPYSAWAQGDPLPGVLDGFKKWYGQINSLYADFLQTTFNPLWGEEQKAKGEFWFEKPGLMRWKYLSPQEDIIIFNQEGFFWYVPEDNQLIKREKDEAFRTISPMSILGENMELEKDFEITGIEDARGETKDGDKNDGNCLGYVILLKPKSSKMAIQRIGVKVRGGDFSLAGIEVVETSGNRNRIEFKNLRINPEVPANHFRLKIPPGTKVITPNDFPSL